LCSNFALHYFSGMSLQKIMRCVAFGAALLPLCQAVDSCDVAEEESMEEQSLLQNPKTVRKEQLLASSSQLDAAIPLPVTDSDADPINGDGSEIADLAFEEEPDDEAEPSDEEEPGDDEEPSDDLFDPDEDYEEPDDDEEPDEGPNEEGGRSLLSRRVGGGGRRRACENGRRRGKTGGTRRRRRECCDRRRSVRTRRPPCHFCAEWCVSQRQQYYAPVPWYSGLASPTTTPGMSPQNCQDNAHCGWNIN